MPLFRFVLKTNLDSTADLAGEVYPDAASARANAEIVARELMRNRERETRNWRLEIQDEAGTRVDTVTFISLDETFQRFPPQMRANVEGFHKSTASLTDTINALHLSMLQVRATMGRADHVLHLAAVGGKAL